MAWFNKNSGSFADFVDQVSTVTRHEDWPLAAAIEKNIPIYEGADVSDAARDPSTRQAYLEEWSRLLLTGPGTFAIKRGIADPDIVDRATEIFDEIILREQQTGAGGGDHFAKPGANARVWNALEKHCIADPENFAQYYGCDGIAMASEAWLGPNYQVTAQVNRVNPGGAAQTPHRDYHLGFMKVEDAMRYPPHMHQISPVLTLQGGVAHLDMPIESGPTMLLPYSQLMLEGYIAFGREEFQNHFQGHSVQLGLEKGDLLFFNPALMHGAGTNQSEDILRLVNLLQVSSAFGIPIESVNRPKMAMALQPVLAQAKAHGTLTDQAIENVIAASTAGYAYPTNLDTDPPVGGLAPITQAQLMRNALVDGMSEADFCAEIAAQQKRQEP